MRIGGYRLFHKGKDLTDRNSDNPLKSAREMVRKNRLSLIFNKKLEVGNVILDYTIQGHDLWIAQIKSKTPQKLSELRTVFAEITKLAERNKVKSIKAFTWIFFEYPKVAKIIGFELEKGTDIDYNRMLEENHVVKIVGDLFNDNSPSKLLGITDSGKTIELPIMDMKVWPTWVKKID